MQSIRKITGIRNTAILLIYCPDKQGILAAVTEFLNENRGNIIYLDQHVDHEEGLFYMRVEWELEKFAIPREKISDWIGFSWWQRLRLGVFCCWNDGQPHGGGSTGLDESQAIWLPIVKRSFFEKKHGVPEIIPVFKVGHYRKRIERY